MIGNKADKNESAACGATIASNVYSYAVALGYRLAAVSAPGCASVLSRSWNQIRCAGREGILLLSPVWMCVKANLDILLLHERPIL